MKSLPDRFKVPQPSRRDRKRMPAAAMAYWSPEGWAVWLTDGARLSLSDNREDRLTAFAPLTQDPELDGPAELAGQLRMALSPGSTTLLKEGLGLCLSAWSWEDGADTASFLLRLSGWLDGPAPQAALRNMLVKPHNFPALKGVQRLADAVAFVLSKRADPATVRDMTGLIEPLLVHSRSASILVAARQAIADPESFIQQLKRLVPDLFRLAPEHDHWRFVANKLIERAGVRAAVKAAFASADPETRLLRTALACHRLDFPDSPPPGRRLSRFVVRDRSCDRTYELDWSDVDRDEREAAKVAPIIARIPYELLVDADEPTKSTFDTMMASRIGHLIMPVPPELSNVQLGQEEEQENQQEGAVES